MWRRGSFVVVFVALFIAVCGCAEPEPRIAEVAGEIEEPETVEVTREVTKVVEKPTEETVEVTRPAERVVTATAPTTLPPALTVVPRGAPEDRDPDAPLPPTTPPGTPTVAPSPSLAIEAFTVDAVELSDGRRRLTFAWKTSGASSVSISLRTRYRFAPYWGSLPPNGTHVFEGDTLYPNPRVFLSAQDSEGHMIQETFRLDWPCRYPYFFTAEAEADCPIPSHRLCTCPRHPAIITQAVEQPFESGRMIWFQGTDDEPSYPDTILVLYEDLVHEGKPDFYQAEFYNDAWTPDEPDRDPDLAPPAGLFRPVRGFGKLWRRDKSVRERMGWATGPEREFEGVWQRLGTESLGADAFFRTADDRLVFFTGWWMSGGSWTFVTP